MTTPTCSLPQSISQEFFAAFKPAGLSSHETEKGLSNGFIEYLVEIEKRPLWLTHRLDKGTSGVMLVAASKKAAEFCGKLFESQSVRKVYHFVTDKTAPFDGSVYCSSLIEKGTGGNTRWTSENFRSLPVETTGLNSTVQNPVHSQDEKERCNSATQFRVVRTHGNLSLVEAIPVTGKTHQIRLHARDLGLTILGDSEYGGTPFIRMCLHCSAMSFKIDPHTELNSDQDLHQVSEQNSDQTLHQNLDLNFEAPMPLFFEKLELILEPMLCKWYDAFHRRQMLFDSQLKVPSSTLRLLHSEADPLRVDKLGDVLWAGWWSPTEPTAKELKLIEGFLLSIGKKLSKESLILDSEKSETKSTLSEIESSVKWQLQFRSNREAHKEASHLTWGTVPELEWPAQENLMKFVFKTDSGLSPGLFLDQRLNREWVQLNVRSKKVLNLFSYTGGFSVAAALGGASLVVSVDASKAYLDWSRENFSLNQIDVSKHQFWAFDTFEFLEMKIRKKESFDFIICDPPSFGRSKKSIFKFEKDFGALLENLKRVLAPNGQILFSSNFEKWDNEEFSDKLAKECRRLNLIIKNRMLGDYDFEMPRTHANLKAYLIERRL